MPQYKGTIDRIDENKAVIILTDHRVILWPADRLPANITTGSVVTVALELDTTQTHIDRNDAKEILNEILKGSQS